MENENDFQDIHRKTEFQDSNFPHGGAPTHGGQNFNQKYPEKRQSQQNQERADAQNQPSQVYPQQPRHNPSYPQPDQSPVHQGYQGVPASHPSYMYPGNPMYYRPYAPYQPKKKILGLTGVAWVIIIIIMLPFLLVCFLILSDYDYVEDRENRDDYSYNVTISSGGHYDFIPKNNYWIEDRIIINISSDNGELFDVYLMDENQYMNWYGDDDSNRSAFSSEYSEENVSSVNHDVEWERELRYPIHVIVDNSDIGLREEDAIGEDTISVQIRISVITHYGYD